MRPAAWVVDPMWGHKFILEPLPEVAQSILLICTVKRKQILYSDIILSPVPFKFEAGDFIELLVLVSPVNVRVQQIVDLLIIELNVGAGNI